jgi:hypothetical protein
MEEVKVHCDGINLGEGALAECVSDLIAESELEDAESGAGVWQESFVTDILGVHRL